MSSVSEILDDGRPGDPRIVLAHGAGAPMDSDWMEAFTRRLVARRLRVLRFEFPYMRQRRDTGRRRPPDRMPALERAWCDVVTDLGEAENLFIGGKSMGGRVATRVADRLGVAGVVCLGYPFHPAGKPERLRTAHLADLRTPTLILQGTRDRLGNRDEVAGYELSPAVRVRWLQDGDHSLEPRVRSGLTLQGHLDEAADDVAAFVRAAR